MINNKNPQYPILVIGDNIYKLNCITKLLFRGGFDNYKITNNTEKNINVLKEDSKYSTILVDTDVKQNPHRLIETIHEKWPLKIIALNINVGEDYMKDGAYLEVSKGAGVEEISYAVNKAIKKNFKERSMMDFAKFIKKTNYIPTIEEMTGFLVRAALEKNGYRRNTAAMSLGISIDKLNELIDYYKI